MILRPLARYCLGLPLLFAAVTLPAQEQAPLIVRVNDVNFDDTDFRGFFEEDWLRMEIELEMVAFNPDENAPNRDWTQNITVSPSVAYPRENAPAGESPYLAFRSEATLVALQRGEPKTIHFYLPPEIFEVLGLNRAEPFAFLIKLSVEGQEMPINRENDEAFFIRGASANAQTLRSYRDNVLTTASRNDGILRPQYLMPTEPEQAESPSFVREEQQ